MQESDLLIEQMQTFKKILGLSHYCAGLGSISLVWRENGSEKHMHIGSQPHDGH